MIQSGIRKKLFLIHMTLVVWVVVGMAINSYRSQWTLTKDIAEQYYSTISQRFIAPISLAMAGNNYANVSLPVFTEELNNLSSLVYMAASGLSDTNTQYSITYHKDDKKVRRSYYENGHEKQLFDKIEVLENKQLADPDSEKKLSYLLDRAHEELSQFHENKIYKAKLGTSLDKLLAGSKTGVSDSDWLLRVDIPTTNDKGGAIVFIYDMSVMKAIREDMISNSFWESLIALLLSFPLVWFTGQMLVKPIESLTGYISSNVNDIDPEKIPGVKRNDEIGFLAKRFQSLVANTNSQIKKIESLSVTDPLTGLFNRRYYNQTIEQQIAHSQSSKRVLSFVFVDIDNFKKYNDNYGHALGDEVLRRVGRVFQEILPGHSDLCFRWGGEEFLMLLQTHSYKESEEIAERIRQAVCSQGIDHAFNHDHGCITVSVGLASCRFAKGDSPVSSNDMLAAADTELYKAKNNKGNSVSATEVDCLPMRYRAS